MRHHRLNSVLAALFLCSLIATSSGCEFTPKDRPQAVRGVLDLSGWDFARRGPVSLAGEFEFFWNRHIDPPAFISASAHPERSGFIRVPGFWNGYRVGGTELPGQGYATYRLTIMLGGPRPALALKVQEVATAFRLFIDESMLAEVGTPGLTPETTVPRQVPVLVRFTPASDRVVLLIQVSNFHHRRGGLWEQVTIGSEEGVVDASQRSRMLDFFLLGGIFVMAVYHLGLYLARSRFRSTLYFGIFCLLVGLRLFTTDERYLVQVLPAVDWSLMIRVEYLSFYLAVPVFGLFIQSLFRVFPRNLLRLVLVIGLAFSAIVVLTPVRVFSYSLPQYELFTLALILYLLYTMLVKFGRQQVETVVFLIGTCLLCLAAVNDMLYVERIIQTGFFVPLGLFAFVFAQAFILYLQMLKAYTLVEAQRVELRDTLESYKQEVLERIRIEEALRESEEKYRTILNSIQEGYYEVDLSGNLTFFNDSLSGILGYTREEMMGMNNRRYMSPEAAKRVYDTFIRVYRTGEPAKAFDWEVLDREGERKTVEASVTLIRDPKGAHVGFRGVVRDITERRRAEEQAKLHQQQLMQTSKMAALGVLVSGVAHEINNPNNFIMLNAPILRDAWMCAQPILEEYYRENGDFLMGGMPYSEMRRRLPTLLDGVSQGSERIKQIVANLKHYVRGDSGDLGQIVDVNAVVESSISLISNVIKNSTDRFKLDFERGLPPVRGSFQRLEQVIINLLQNACHSLSDRKKGIFVRTAQVDGGEQVLISIRDEGRGISPGDLPRIREPFFTTRQDAGGIGLGLSISSKIIEEHQGSLHFDSAPGSGTTVTITLPAGTGRTV